MKKVVLIFVAASIAAASCSKMGENESAPSSWKTTVRLVPSVESKTSLDESAHLLWTAGDMVSYWTSADGVSFGMSSSAEVVDGAFSATIPAGHSHMKVVYPAVADGSEYAVPSVKKFQNHSSVGSFDGRYLPMIAEKDDVVEGVESIDVSYTVLGAVLRFKVTGSGSLKAVRAGDYQADFLNTAELSSSPIDVFVVVPTATNVYYRPRAFVIATDGTYREYLRRANIRVTLSAKAYEANMPLGDSGWFVSHPGWIKASDIGLSVAWADINYGGDKQDSGEMPYSYDLMEWRTSFENIVDDLWGWDGEWRLPTEAEILELVNLNQSKKMMTTMEGVKGCMITNNNASIFLPVGGYLNAYYGDRRSLDSGYYWYNKYAGTSNRYGGPVDRYYCMTFSSATDFSASGTAFDEDSRAIRLVRPLN